MSNPLLARLKKASKIEGSDQLDQSEIFNRKDFTATPVPMMNVALSGSFDGGLTSGLTVLAGPSKHFKTAFGLIMVAAYLAKRPKAVCLFYDNEFGSPPQYITNFGVDMSRVLHTPFMNLEQLKFDLVNQLDKATLGEDIIVFIDSVGSGASKKEIEDALNDKSVADMTRAKAIKSLFRMITPYLATKNIPLIAVNHTYMTQEMFSKPVVSGGTGIYYSANTIWIVGRQTRKEGVEVMGYNFIINVEKSRFVKEKSKIPVIATWANGIEKYSGLLDIAMAGGFVVKPSMGWYAKCGDPKSKKLDPGKFRERDTYTAEFWDPLLSHEPFKEFVKAHYTVGYRSMIEGEFLAGVEIDPKAADPEADE